LIFSLEFWIWPNHLGYSWERNGRFSTHTLFGNPVSNSSPLVGVGAEGHTSRNTGWLAFPVGALWAGFSLGGRYTSPLTFPFPRFLKAPGFKGVPRLDTSFTVSRGVFFTPRGSSPFPGLYITPGLGGNRVLRRAYTALQLLFCHFSWGTPLCVCGFYPRKGLTSHSPCRFCV